MAPEVGLEPTTHRLTADCSTIELLWNRRRPDPGPALGPPGSKEPKCTNHSAHRQTDFVPCLVRFGISDNKTCCGPPAPGAGSRGRNSSTACRHDHKSAGVPDKNPARRVPA